MNSQPNFTEQLKTAFATTTRGTRVLILLGLVVGVLILAQYGNRPSNVRTTGLFTGSTLRRSDIHRMEIAFGAAGLDDFEIRGNEVYVPRNLRSQYLKALETHNALPAELKMADDDGPAMNPFMTHSQQKVIAASEKKKQIRQMISQLPFVDQVWLELDSEETNSAFSAPRQSALVSVQPENAVALTAQQVETVRQMVDAALASIDREHIVIADMNVGRAYRADETAGKSPEPESPFSQANFSVARTHNLQLQTETRVRQALADYPMVTANVQVHTETPPPILVEQATIEQPIAQPAPIQKMPVQSLAVAGANGKASIHDDSFGDEPPIDPQPVQAQPIPQTKLITPPPVNRVTVQIAVPEVVLHQRVARTGMVPTELSERQNRMQAEYESLRAELLQRVAPCLPEDSFDAQLGLPIEVSVLPNESPVETRTAWNSFSGKVNDWRSQVKPFLMKHWPTMAVLLVGLMLLTVLKRSSSPVSPTETLMPKTDPIAQADQTDIGQTSESEISIRRDTIPSDHVDQNEDDPMTDRERDAALIARKQLSEAIDKDPEATA